jgi:serine/threonine protein kinase/Tfp pilus assembly protein PilF
MNGEELEELVARFLDQRDADPGLEVEAFARAHPEGGPGLAGAIRSTLEVLGQLPTGMLAFPRAIGPYRLVKELGRGGMGVVYEVTGEGGLRAALKLLPPAAMIGLKGVERFRREFEALHGISDPGIVGVRDSGSYEGCPFLVMDLVEGEALVSFAGKIEPRRAAEIVRDLARALASAHARGVLHRDHKPHNVIVRPDGRPVLVDFGLVALEGEATLTSTGAMLGTPRYMPPEQAEGRGVDVRSDVYGLGAILYELLVGRPAHDQESRARVLESVIAGRFPRPRSLRGGIAKDLERIVLHALAWDPRRRPAGALELAADLDRFLEGRSVLARPPARTSHLLRAVRAHPSRSLAFAGVTVAALAALAFGLDSWISRRAQTRRLFELGRDRAIAAWALGNPARAKRELTHATSIVPRDPECRTLLANLDAGSDPLGLAPPAAATLIPESGALAAILQARSLRREGDPAGARRLLEERSTSLPGSVAVRAELADVLEATGAMSEAEAVCSEAIGLDPENPELHERLSSLLFARGEIVQAVTEAHVAAAHSEAAGEGSPTRLLGMLRRAPDATLVREELRARLAKDPGRDPTRFALAASYDTDHHLREAREEYEKILHTDPRHAAATLYLANLRLGADCGRCLSCDESYAREPEVLDREEGTRLLLRTIELDRGADEGLLRTITAISIVHGVLDPVAGALESLLAGGTSPSVATRVRGALDRLRQAGARR